ncbi:MAG: LCP family protein [Actinomycetota bacterium]|nr:LCP family protein [Actinomycetota bacterium]
MADRPRDRDGRGYGWLYGDDEDEQATRRVRAPGRGTGSPSDDPEPTRMMPLPGRDDRSERPRQRSAPAAPPPSARPAPARRSRPRPRWGRIVGLVLLAWLVFLVAVPIWAWTKIDKVDAEPDRERPGNTLGSTYLLVGSDSREGLSKRERRKLSTGNAAGARTDTVLLLHEPAFGGKTLLISLPRDSIVDIPGVGTTKINAAFAEGGPELLVETVENETGLYVDSYVEIGLGGFVNVVDAVGGVEICPKQRLKDPKAGLNIKKGCQQADGVTALGYARSRKLYATGDIQRGQAQREVLGKVAGKAASPWSVVNPFRYFSINSAGAESLRIGENVGPIDLARFAWAVRKVNGDDGKTCTVPIANLAVEWDEERATALFDLIREGDTEDVGRRLCSRTGLPR